jgi:hypothetical protein
LRHSELRAVERSCRDLWERRGRITEILGTDLPREVEQQAKNDLLELALLAATLRVALARAGEESRARREALGMLAEVETMLGPSPVLFHERWLLAEAQGLPELARKAQRQLSQAPARMAPTSAVALRRRWSHFRLVWLWHRAVPAAFTTAAWLTRRWATPKLCATMTVPCVWTRGWRRHP